MYQIKLGDKSPVPYIFTNSNIVTPHSVINNGTLVVEGEKITFVGSILPPELKSRTESVYIDVGGKYILPGLIDSHSDAIELELVPTDSNSSTIQQALINLDYKFASLGITTTLHALPLTDAPFKQRSISHSEQIIETIIPFKEISLIDHMIFARCDILLDADSLSRVITILKKYRINIASLQDHSPGQGQFQDKVKLEKYLIHNYGMNPTDAEDYVKRMLFLRETRSQYNATQIANEIREAQGVLISHDDDTIEKIKWMRQLGISITEFPINQECAKFAYDQGIFTSFGSPNFVRGQSHSGNVSVKELVKANKVHILCSDYAPETLPQCIPLLIDVGYSLVDAMKLLSTNPAIALGLNDRGQIATGKKADIIIADFAKSRLAINATMAKGNFVYGRLYR